jgi:hypothetical protein
MSDFSRVGLKKEQKQLKDFKPKRRPDEKKKNKESSDKRKSI